MINYLNRSAVLLRRILLVVLIISISGCASMHKKSVTSRKKGFMLLENTSQGLNKKYKKSHYARKMERQRKRARH
jgi:uncharacterized protein YceK